MTLLYDGDCDFCTRSAREAATWSLDIEPLPLQDASVPRRFPSIELAAALESMHVVHDNGVVERGARAWCSLARVGPPHLRLAAALFWIPGVPWVAERIYRAIAARRYRGGTSHRDCDTGACFADPKARAAEIQSTQSPPA